jgi:hypothetical protein
MALFNYSYTGGTRRCFISGWKVFRVNQNGNRTFTGQINANGGQYSITAATGLRVTSGNVGISNSSPTYKLDVGSNAGQSATAGAAGLIRNGTSADQSPYTQARIFIYGGTNVDGGNYAYLAYGSDASCRFIYAKTGAGAPLYFGTSSAFDGTGSVTNRMWLDTSGNLFTTGDVYTSYSDVRLKDIKGNIENPLDKLRQIETFYYEPNEVAISLGATAGRKIGVSAQSVLKVLPEVVSESPLNNEYLTVQYEKMVPLLIESIKELEKIVKDQQEQINKLKGL